MWRDVAPWRGFYMLPFEERAGYEARIAALEAENARLRALLESDALETRAFSTSLLESEERFRTLAELAPAGIYLLDASGACVFANARFREMAGLDMEAASGRGWLTAVHPADAEGVERDLSLSVASGGRFGREFRLRSPDGRETWVFAVASPLRDASGVVTGFVGVQTDLTWLKADEEALREYERVIENLDDMVSVVDDTHRYTLVNRRYAEAQGAPKRFLIGCTLAEILGREVYEREVKPHLDQAFAGTSTAYEMKREIVGAGLRDMSVRYFPLRDAGSSVVNRVVAILHDRTERKALEERVRRAELFETVGTLAGGVAHDLNNMLSPALGVVDLLLLDVPEGNPMRDDLAIIRGAVMSAAEEVQDLLVFARRAMMAKGPVDPAGILAGFERSPLVARTRELRPEIAWSFDASAPLPVFSGSAQHVSRALHNLAANAIESIPQERGGTLRIACRAVRTVVPTGNFETIPPGEYLEFSVSDDGAGIPPEERSHVFEPFRSRRRKNWRLGAGLSLAVVHGVAKDHGGYVDVESSPGAGSRFRMLLPLAPGTGGQRETGSTGLV